ncbi:unnamed protein product [Hymenolepis diminuta]|uniref:G_PROTEIN_RECEP_F1_2 domain-containing protein n=2 Tax=Hymenolepis diminuta TaxID=6216 RepID=A0A0R3SSV5_HYMDI|nr:unnamed protein product [Hymenolepis diminuta]
MQPTGYFGAIIILLQSVLETSSQGVSVWKSDSDDNWAPSSQSIRYSKWAAERRSTTTTPKNFRTTSVRPPEIENVFRIHNTTDLLFRYHEAERKQKGNVFNSPFNTPIFDTATSIPSVIKSNALKKADIVVYGKASTVIIVILTIIASSVTIGGNVLVLAAFYLERTLRIPTNYFIASLAVTDVLIGIFSMNLYSLYLLLGYWPLGRELCDLWLGLDYTLCLTSQYTVFFITLDRFFSVKIPAKYRNWRTGNKILIMIAITWILPSSIFFTTLLGWPHFSESNFVRQKMECYAEFSSNPMFNTILTITYFWVTLTVMTGLYIGIYMVALRLQKKSEKKKAKVRNYLNMNQNVSGKIIALNQNEAEIEFAESYHLASSNETGARVTSGEFDSTPVPQYDSQKPLQISTKPPLDQNREDKMPYCGPVTSIRNTGNTNDAGPICNKARTGVYANECFSDSNSYPLGNSSPKASPTSIAETVFVDIRSPHLSDPEIPESTKIFEKDLYSFPSSPAVHIFNDMENSSEDSSLKLSFAYSNPNRSYNSITGEPLSKFEKDQESDKVFNGFDYTPPSYECRPSMMGKRNSNVNQMTLNEGPPETNLRTQVCPFPGPDLQKANIDVRRVSKATAARVAQIWQDRLMMQEDKYQKANHDSKVQPTQNSNSRNSRNNSSGSRTTGTSRNPLRSGRKKKGFNSYFQQGQESSTNGANQAPMERGRTANRARKALKTISFILGAFVICWTPYHIVILIKGFCDNPKTAYSCVNSHLYSVTYWMCYMNSPINPFCYALANAQFKQAFLRILRFDFKRR